MQAFGRRARDVIPESLVTADHAYFDKAKHLGGIELLSDFAI